MDDKEIIEVLKKLRTKKGLSATEKDALSGAIGALALMAHTSESYLKKLKAKRERGE